MVFVLLAIDAQLQVGFVLLRLPLFVSLKLRQGILRVLCGAYG